MRTRAPRFVALAVGAAVALGCSGGSSKSTPATTATTTSAGSSSTSPPSSSASSSSDATRPAFLAIVAPAGVDPADFGQNVSVAMTTNAAPVVAFTVLDPTTGTSTVETATYDPTTDHFAPSVVVATATVSDAHDSVSIVRADDGSLALAWDDDNQIFAAQSTDDGATWHPVLAVPKAPAVRSPSIATSHGKVLIAFIGADAAPAYVTGDFASGVFTPGAVPPPPNATPRPFPPAAAAASDGTFGLTYLADDATGGVTVEYQAIGATAPVAALDSSGIANPSATTALAYGPHGPVIGATVCRTADEASTDACTWVAVSNDNGATFAPPVSVPADHHDSGGVVARVGADTVGNGVLVYTPSRAGGDAVCGQPKIAVSVDLRTWRTCSPDTSGSLGLVPGPPAIGAAPNGADAIAFQQTSSSAKAPVGILVVIYAPPSSARATQ